MRVHPESLDYSTIQQIVWFLVCKHSCDLPIEWSAKLSSNEKFDKGTSSEAGIIATVPRLDPPKIWLSTGKWFSTKQKTKTKKFVNEDSENYLNRGHCVPLPGKPHWFRYVTWEYAQDEQQSKEKQIHPVWTVMACFGCPSHSKFKQCSFLIIGSWKLAHWTWF